MSVFIPSIKIFEVDEGCSCSMFSKSIESILGGNRLRSKLSRISNEFIIICSLITFIIVSCTPTDNPEDDSFFKSGTDFLSFQLKDVGGSIYSPLFPINDSIIHIKIPAGSDCQFVPVFSINGAFVIDNITGAEVSSNNTFQDFSDFASPRSYQVVSDTGDEKTYSVFLYDLPVLVLNSPEKQPIESKEERVEGCTLSLIGDDGVVVDLGTAGVRGRGNSTWEQPKKPYNVKLDSKKSILGMKSSKHWLLLSQPYYDRTQLHNITAFEMAHLSDYVWSESGAFVELILNGEYRGLYLLCEKIDVEKDKISIKNDSKVDVANQTCLLESYITGENLESLVLPDYCFTTDYFNVTGPWWARLTMAWEIKYPDEESNEVKQGIIDRLNRIERLLSDDEAVIGGLYRSSFDIGSFCDWWLIQEAVANMEASKSKNVFMYFDSDSLLKMGPPWDFDAYAFGQYGEKFTWLCKNDALYYKQLFKDPVFVNTIKEKWTRYYPIWKKEIPVFISKEHKRICRAAKRNEKMWPVWLGINKYPEVEYDNYVEDMKNWFVEQLEWMNEQIAIF